MCFTLPDVPLMHSRQVKPFWILSPGVAVDFDILLGILHRLTKLDVLLLTFKSLKTYSLSAFFNSLVEGVTSARCSNVFTTVLLSLGGLCELKAKYC